MTKGTAKGTKGTAKGTKGTAKGTSKMRVLVGCEFSGTVRDAFKTAGADAWSNDLLETEQPGQHITGDVVDAINAGDWDLIILHPPCTALAVSGNAWYGKGMRDNDKRHEAITWTLGLWELAKSKCSKVCLENPVGVLPIKPTQYVQPWQYGHGETKKTGLTLHGLPPLEPTDIVDGREPRVHMLPPSKDRWKLRSLTYQGIADAMANQWA